MKNVFILDSKGKVIYEFLEKSRDEKRVREEIKSQLFYDLLALSKLYQDRDEIFDFMESATPEIYPNNIFTQDLLKFVFGDEISNLILDEIILITNKNRELIVPRWTDTFFDNPEWTNLRKKSQELLSYFSIDYQSINLDDYIEENNL